MKISEFKKFNLPDKPGVYFFLKGKSILYIGKATSLRSRTKSYFGNDLIVTRGPLILDMVTKADSIKWQETDSVLEALVLEASLIKKHQPYYNTKEKDDKSFNYVCINKDFKVLVVRGKNLKKENYKKFYGPFPSGDQLRIALRILRKIFPFNDEYSSKKYAKDFYKQLSLVPDEKYKENIKNLCAFFEGKKQNVVKSLQKRMKALAKGQKFEDANEIKKQIFALTHINDVALIKEDIFTAQNHANFPRLSLPRPKGEARAHTYSENSQDSATLRIEAYDIAHMSGANMVGVMTVVDGGEPNKSEYKKFNIKSVKGANDPASLREVLSRRFAHKEWQYPDVIVVDGNDVQINVVKKVLAEYNLEIPVLSVVKDIRHKAKGILGDAKLAKAYKKAILLANSEAHRFAITFYRQKSRKNMLK